MELEKKASNRKLNQAKILRKKTLPGVSVLISSRAITCHTVANTIKNYFIPDNREENVYDKFIFKSDSLIDVTLCHFLGLENTNY